MPSGFDVRPRWPCRRLLDRAWLVVFMLASASLKATPDFEKVVSLVAQFEVRARPSGTLEHWYLYRSTDVVHVLAPGHEDIWRRNSAGQISLERVFPAEAASVFYTPGELEARGVHPDWLAVAGLWDPREAPSAARESDGTDGWRWRSPGLEVHWSDTLALPRQLIRHARSPAGSSVHWRLIAHHTERPSTWPAPAAPVEVRVDASDLGDRMDDPFARAAEALEARSGWQRPHGH